MSVENVVAVEGVKDKHAVRSQNVFRHIVRRAERKGMKVNASKTNVICISDSQNFDVRAHFFDSDGTKISSGPKMKILGWHFSSSPTVAAHVEVIKRRFRERYWVLRHLKRNSFSPEDLIKVYKSIVRPVADYMQEVYHSMLTDRQDEEIERLQTHVLKCVYGPRLSGRRMRQMADVTTLRNRRIEAVDKFAAKNSDSDRFYKWFPKNERRRSTRRADEYVEEYARCNRLFFSPLFYMRRLSLIHI